MSQRPVTFPRARLERSAIPAGTCTYTFQHAIPAGAKGSFAIGIESRRTETLLAGTTTQMDVRYGAANKVFYFSVDGSPVQPRRTVVQTASCNQCHSFLSFHGDNRNQVEMCVLCHNPSLTADPDEANQLARGVNFNLLIHRVHTGYKYYADVRYPAMSPQGGPGDTRNCAMCHVNESHTTPAGIHDVLDPQGFINPVKPITVVVHRLPRDQACFVACVGQYDSDRGELRGLSQLRLRIRGRQIACAVLAWREQHFHASLAAEVASKVEVC